MLELLIALALFTLVSAATFELLWQGQKTQMAQAELAQTEQEVRTAMDQIIRYLRHAGNDPRGYLRANGMPALEIESVGDSVVLRINSDITGSNPSLTGDPKEATGDPDGALDSLHERVTVRLDGETLGMDIGYGQQTIAHKIKCLQLTFFDKYGQPTNQADSALRVRVELVAEPNLSLKSDVFLRRSSYNAFYR